MIYGPDERSVIRVRPGRPDKHGDPTAAEPDVAIDGVRLAPRGSSENLTGADTVIVGLTMYAPVDADIRASDQIRVDDVLWDVEGEPGVWPDEGLQVALTRVRG